MNSINFLVIYLVIFVVGQSTVLFKRMFNLSYDRKVIVALIIFTIATIVAHFLGGYSLRAQGDRTLNIVYLVWVVTGFNAILQYLFWLLFSFLLKKNVIKLPRFLFDIFIFIILVIITIFWVKAIFDREMEGIVIGSTVVSAVIGLSLQDTLSNLFAGIALQIEAPFEIGDWVVLGGHEGKIISQNWRTLTLQTRESHYISFTNKQVSNEKIINYSRPSQRQIYNLFITLDYSHPPNVVKEVLNRLIDEVDEVQADARLGAFVHSYEDYGIKYVMKFWLYDYADIVQILDKVQSRLWYILKRKDIKIPFPIHELHVENEYDHRVADNLKNIRLGWHKELGRIPLLMELNETQLQFLADNIDMQLFSKEDLLVKQGDIGDSMFFILSGQAKVYLEDETGKIYVADKKKGDYFGEMSLLTGNPRSATVVAKTDMNTAIINKKSFSEILAQDENILDDLLTALEKNNADLSDLIDKAKKDRANKDESARTQVIKFVKRYLGLLEA